jgi:hypothetical protein
MNPMKGEQCRRRRRTFLAIVLLPIFFAFLWLEVEIGVSYTWAVLVGYVSPSQPDVALGIFGAAATIAGPMAVGVATLKTRGRSLSVTDRLLRVEYWGSVISAPVVMLGFVFVVMASVI